jgi:hypothetical protein
LAACAAAGNNNNGGPPDAHVIPGIPDAPVVDQPDAPVGPLPDASHPPTIDASFPGIPDAMIPTADAPPPPPGTTLLISEVRTRGAGGAADEFVEIYNVTLAPIVLDATWKIEARSTTSSSFSSRWVATAGVSVPAHGHYLIGGTAYTESPTKDAALSTGITDGTAVRLVHGTTVIDELCLYYDSTTMAAFDATFGCEGTPKTNLPHNNGTSGASNTDVSVERLPGGASGNGSDTNDNNTDFITVMPANPQSTTSPPTP